MSTPQHELHPDFRRPTGPDDLYTTRPPWDIDRPQTAFTALAQAGEFHGRVLDIGCGTGEHALLAAGLGHDTVGIDQSAQAIERAQRKARDRGLDATFLRHDALEPAGLTQTFDTVLDCGLFHIFSPDARSTYVESLAAVLRPGGRYFMLGFSDRQPGIWGPHRLSRNDIESAFTDGWRIDSLRESFIEILPDPTRSHAWLATVTRS
ncbi:class I SAM-dependent methyltransferase [Nocardia sp. NBC_01388]|uniref:class I SAM-dependent methyltransferase n=1 Tax=Nocardia sp. NBC_01388 TaxID=2903596 RepID=UPI00324EC450